MTNPSPPRRRRATPIVAVLGLALAVAGCTAGGGGEPASRAPSGQASVATLAAAPVALAPAWSSSASARSQTVVTNDLVVFIDADRVTTVDRATGNPVSSWTSSTAGGSICSGSPQLGKGRLLGLLLQTRGHRCTTATALDVRTGEARWRVQLTSDSPDLEPGGRDPYFEGQSVAVGDRTLQATMNCSDVRRLALSTGRELATVAPQDLACANQTETDGQRIAVLDFDAEDVRYEDPSGTGFIHVEDGQGAVAFYDADSGRRLWQHLVDNHKGASVSQLLTTDPTVLTTAVDGRSTTRIWADDGTPGPYLGKATSYSSGSDPETEVVGRSADLLVLRYPKSADPQLLHGYDLTTGAERWQLLPPGAGNGGSVSTQASVTSDRLIVAVSRNEGTDLLGYDVTDPGTPEVLGRAHATAATLTGDLLLASDADSGAQAYDVPESGEVRDYQITSQLAWSADDVRPADVLAACEAVSADTLQLARLAWSGLPAPAECSWDRSYQPDYVTRGLSVQVQVGVPTRSRTTGSQESPGDTATDAAREIARSERSYTSAGNETKLPALAAAAHLGDEAWGSFASLAGDPSDGVPVRMVTRWRNVVVTVTASQAVRIEQLSSASIPVDRLQDVVYRATGDVLSHLGAPATMPTRGADGPITAVTNICGPLDAVATGVLPVERSSDGRYGDQQQACVWETGPDDLTSVVVVADAVPGAADGTSAVDRATQVAAVLSATDAPESSIDGLPGLSTLRRYTSDDGDYLVWEATSRVDNLVVTVSYASYQLGQTRAEAEANTGRLMRKAVAAAQA